jgi:tRNA pseudouridine13 synthase
MDLSLQHLSTERIKKTFTKTSENFIVEEIDLDGNVYEIEKVCKPRWEKEEDYVIGVLQKKDWTTVNCLKKICKLLRISKKRVSFAGYKDRDATTTQLFSIYKAKREDVEKIKIKDAKILGSWYWDRPIKAGDLLGNRFTIKINLSDEDILLLGEILEETNYYVPNYYGKQRFGVRENNHKIGKLILKENFLEAIVEYLTASKEGEDEGIKKIRKNLKDNLNFKVALKEYPAFLKNERKILEHLNKHPKDYIGALRTLGNTLLLFVNAYQSYLFNKILSKKIKDERIFDISEGEYFCGLNWYSFPDVKRIDGKIPVGKVIGYDTQLNKEEKEILDEEGIDIKMFKSKKIPELSCRGDYRALIVPVKDFIAKNSFISFELPAGSYGTVALSELLETVK